MDYDTMQGKAEELARDRAAGHAVTWVNEVLQGPDRAGEIIARIEESDGERAELPDSPFGDLPSPDLSGQWADEPTPRDILAEIGYDGDPADETATDLVYAYESEYVRHGEAEVMRILTAHADEDSLQYVAGLSVSDLVTLGDVLYPPDRYPSDGDNGSAGSRLLTLARDAVAERLRERVRIYDTETLVETLAAVYDDLPSELGAELPDDSHGVWAEFVDLGAWTEDVHGMYDPAASTALEDAARAAVSDIVRRVAVAILDDVRERG